jgi:hypothetical protein
MKTFIIAINEIKESRFSAIDARKSCRKFGVEAEIFDAITPENTDVDDMLAKRGIPSDGFLADSQYSRTQRCKAAFLSHMSLWEKCLKDRDGDLYLIMEHDARMVLPVPEVPMLQHSIINMGKPSYGRYNSPSQLGVGPLVSKNYLPGAHGYMISATGAFELIERAKIDGGPTDTYIHNNRFPGRIGEYYPWPIEVKETFTTIQHQGGIAAKHQVNEKYEII